MTTTRKYTKPSDSELRELLTDEQYAVTQEDATEKPFTNQYDEHFEQWLYVDVVTWEPLFSSTDKFNSWCWRPAFSKPIQKDVTTYTTDHKIWYARTEVRSAQWDSHLWHRFTDGPADKWWMRYCINSASLRFVPLEEMEREGYAEYVDLVVEDG